jgi:hypothetical protein
VTNTWGVTRAIARLSARCIDLAPLDTLFAALVKQGSFDASDPHGLRYAA